jgi:hypothetical protein
MPRPPHLALLIAVRLQSDVMIREKSDDRMAGVTPWRTLLSRALAGSGSRSRQRQVAWIKMPLDRDACSAGPREVPGA